MFGESSASTSCARRGQRPVTTPGASTRFCRLSDIQGTGEVASRTNGRFLVVMVTEYNSPGIYYGDGNASVTVQVVDETQNRTPVRAKTADYTQSLYNKAKSENKRKNSKRTLSRSRHTIER
ncbi:unnamed protein product [Amoebophrya sp. A25]|nr:unnamed protein product [Amoebophrya sp. A25]|eukprot:GSA25T00021550001.1